MPRIYNKDVRTWFIFVLVTGLLGFLNVGAPLDLVFNAVRAKIIEKKVSGDTIIVGIDDEALQAIGPWPWSGEQLADLNNRLVQAGAQRIAYTLPLSGLSKDAAETFSQSIDETDAQIYLSATKVEFGGGLKDVWPQDPLSARDNFVSAANFVRFWEGVEYLEYRTLYDDEVLTGLASELSGVRGQVGERFPVDYTYHVNDIPYISAAEAIKNRIDEDALIGRNVLVGMNSARVSQLFKVPGQENAPPVFVHALGVETLKAGRPLNLGMWPLWWGACLFSLLIFSDLGRKHAVLASNTAVLALLAAPLALVLLRVHFQSSPAFLLLLFTAVSVNRRRFGDKQRSCGSVNPLSGLKTLNAVRLEDGNDQRYVVACCIRRFADIISALPPGGERAVVMELVKRLELCTGQAELFQGEDGGFYWYVDAQSATDLDDQFRAMALIFRTPVSHNEQSFDINISFGVDAETGLAVSSRFVNALSAAQDAQRDEVLWKQHDPAQREAKTWELTFRADLERALACGEIWVAFQPQISLHTGELQGCEALVRWTHATRGPISPQLFVEQAERNGGIEILTEFVLNRSLKVVKELQARNVDVPVSVNLSPRLLDEDGFVEQAAAALETHALDARLLTLEITETRQIIYNNNMQQRMMKLRDLGVGLSIDDYGTGMSTLEYLRQIPATELKIDRCFTSGICNNAQDRVLIKSTVELAHALNMSVVVEGVETLEVQELSRQLGADFAQGYGISHPLACTEYIDWVENYKKIPTNFNRAC